MAKLNTNSNSYIIAYSCVMVVVVAFLLAFVSSALKPTQDVNVALDKKKQILAALNIRNLSDEQSSEEYTKVINADAVIDEQGNVTNPGTKGRRKGRLPLEQRRLQGRKACDIRLHRGGQA